MTLQNIVSFLLICTMAYGQQQQQQQQQQPQVATSSRFFNNFTPIRLIQPQSPEQQELIQSLVQEIRKSSPQLFSNIGQPQQKQQPSQIALAVPQTASQPPRPVSTPLPIQAAASVFAIADATDTRQPLASDSQGDSEEMSFVFDALFNNIDHDSGLDTSELPFGLHFDPSTTSTEDGESSSSGATNTGSSDSELEMIISGLEKDSSGASPCLTQQLLSLAVPMMATICIWLLI